MFKLIFFVFMMNTCCTYSQENYPRVQSILYEMEDNIKIISDSILLDGFLIFEFTPENPELGFDKSKKFFTFSIFFISDINDIKHIESSKIYYNSNKILYGFYSFSDMSKKDSIKRNNKQKFVETYDKNTNRRKSGLSTFMIENINFEIFKENESSFFQFDTLSSSGFFAFRSKFYAYIFTTQYETYKNKKFGKDDKVTLLFFEPISSVVEFDLIKTLPDKHFPSNIFKNYLEE